MTTAAADTANIGGGTARTTGKPAETPTVPRTAPTLLRRYGTQLLRTELYELPDHRYVWRRTPGPLAPTPFVRPDTETRWLLAALKTNGLRLAVGRPEGLARTYRTGGHRTVARQLLTDGVGPGLIAPMRDLGRTLRALHDTPALLPPPAGPPRGLHRLGRLLAGRPGVPRAAQAALQLERVLGPDRWDRLAHWYAEVAADERLVPAHGGTGLGVLVTGGPEGTDALLTGEDLAAAPWYLDLGWVVGELVELRWQIGGRSEDWQALLTALYEGYGRDLGEDWRRLAALRILLHVHDAAAYHPQHIPDFRHYAGFLRFLTDLQR